jgi:predicted lactoylglutathione lyase
MIFILLVVKLLKKSKHLTFFSLIVFLFNYILVDKIRLGIIVNTPN